MERPSVRHRSRGVSLLELVSSLAILGFVVAATAGLYVAGQRSHFRARYYSDAQTTIRRALRDLTRTTRMAESVLAKGTTGTLNGQTTGASQLVLRLTIAQAATTDSSANRSPWAKLIIRTTP